MTLNLIVMAFFVVAGLTLHNHSSRQTVALKTKKNFWSIWLSPIGNEMSKLEAHAGLYRCTAIAMSIVKQIVKFVEIIVWSTYRPTTTFLLCDREADAVRLHAVIVCRLLWARLGKIYRLNASIFDKLFQ